MTEADAVEYAAELSTVAPDYAVVHDGAEVRRYDELKPDTDYDLDGFAFHTLRAPGELLATIATVNDVHLGETEAGVIEGTDIGPVMRSAPGEEPYPEMMNRAAIAEIAAASPEAVIAKGDLTSMGTQDEYEAFCALYSGAFGERLFHVRGNHDACHGGRFAAFPYQRIDVEGVTVALLDTAVVDQPNGQVRAEQLDWLDALAAEADVPVLVMGHHHCWSPDNDVRDPGYFGINPGDSEQLIALVHRRRAVVGYFAGHSHRNRRRTFSATGDMPWVEVASVKDYPGSWAEYRIYDGGICQIHHRISSPEALDWTNRTRAMFVGLYTDYAFGDLDDRCFDVPGRA